MKENKLVEYSMDFAVSVLHLTEKITGHYSIKNQLERSATSIGANIREANYAQGRADFVHKLQIALKECYETEYWLELMQRAQILSHDELQKPIQDCGRIRRMLVASVNTVKTEKTDA